MKACELILDSLPTNDYQIVESSTIVTLQEFTIVAKN